MIMNVCTILLDFAVVKAPFYDHGEADLYIFFKVKLNSPFSEDTVLDLPQLPAAPFSKFFQFCQSENSLLKLALTGISVASPAPEK